MNRTQVTLAGLLLLSPTACARPEPVEPSAPLPAPRPAVRPEVAAMSGALNDNGQHIPAVPAKLLTEDKARQVVDCRTNEKPRTIIVDPHARHLYQVQRGNKAMRYTVALALNPDQKGSAT